jgi:cold shock CspA family protein
MTSMETGLLANCTAVRTRDMRGKMLWFNADKDLGALRTEDDERVEVPGSAFAAGARPIGRCVGKVVAFRATPGKGGIAAEEIVFVAEVAPRRARRRRRG